MNLLPGVTDLAGFVEARPGSGLIALLTLSFVVFNTMRIVLYVPQLLTCLRDEHGCSAINLWTWCSWIAASLSNGLYMGLLLQDRWGLLLNLGNALMCAATVVVTCVKRRRFAARRRACAKACLPAGHGGESLGADAVPTTA